MIIYQVLRTAETKGYAEAIFLETISGIYVESPGNGFFQHPRIKTAAQLKEHLEALKSEGFQINKSTITARA